MKVGIIVCGLVDPALVSDYGEYADMIQAGLSPHGDFHFQLYSALDQALPKAADECDGYIVTGSVHDAYTDEPWILNLVDWICQLDAEEKPLIGICFGHQIIARALGGVVEKSPKGWGIGISHNRVLSEQPWMTDSKEDLVLLVSHQDQVQQAPDQMDVLATSEFCPNFMLVKGHHIVTVQGHPEFSKDFEREMIQKRKDRLDDQLYQKALASLDEEPDSDLVMKWFANFLTQA
jgi:GMP synthase-like glutamine amidotransferase